MKTGREIYKQDNSLVPEAKEEGSLSILHLLYNKTYNVFAVVSVDHNIIIHSLETFECKKQVGVLNMFYKTFYKTISHMMLIFIEIIAVGGLYR